MRLASPLRLLVLVLVLVAAGVAAARPAIAQNASETLPMVVLDMREPHEAPRRPPSAATRVVLESFAGLGGGLAASLGTFIVAGTIGAVATSCDGSDFCSPFLSFIVVGGVVSPAGLLIGAPIGVTLMGDANGGHGHWWGAALGSLLSSGLGALAIYATAQTNDGTAVGPIAALAGVGVVAGSVAGYEISGLHSGTPTERQPQARDAFRWVPTAMVDPHGATLGLGGVF